MEEISAIDWNGFNVASTFSGCGGSSLGYRMAGFRVLWANEFIDSARDSYEANKSKHTIVDGRDIREVSGRSILDAIGLKEGELDLLDGSPPCASFSTSGKRDKGWGKVKAYSDKAQRTDDLFLEFSRLLREIKPKTFVAENVSGLVKGKAKGYFLIILRELKSCGYRVSCKVLDAQWLGVPQARQRTIFVGVREDLGLYPVHPEPLPYRYSLSEAVPWIVREKRGGVPDNWQNSDRPASTIVASGAGLSPTAYLSGGTYVEAIVIGRAHSYERRKFTIAELKRVCGFPDDFLLCGKFEQQWERLGRAVPPVMMQHIAAAVRDGVLRKC